MKTLLVVLGAIFAIAASTTALAFLGLPYQPLGREFLQTNPYGAAGISAAVSGSTTPDQLPNATAEDSITNGDFTIFAGQENTTIGDGIDEITVWDFDFTEDPGFDSFPTSNPLQSALLTLTLTPKSSSASFGTDWIRISGLANINPDIYADLAIDETATIELDLLDCFDLPGPEPVCYSSEDILGALQEGDGQITMASQDDAIVSAAELTLVAGP
jgi:hypothetical protein